MSKENNNVKNENSIQENQENKNSEQGKSNPVRKITLFVLLLCVFMFVWYVAADRLTPYTDLARVKAFIIPIAPEVAGKISQINIHSNQFVTAGENLIQIETDQYDIAVKSAQANLDLAGQDVGASTAVIASSQANLANAFAQLKNIQAQYNRLMPLVKKGVISRSDGDRTVAALADAKGKVNTAKAEL
ncbi:MAG: biotin/lipoyl-binding protein, partial [Pseudomonadota bacterium]